MNPVRLDLSRLLGFKIIVKNGDTLIPATVGTETTAPQVDGGRSSALTSAKIGAKPLP